MLLFTSVNINLFQIRFICKIIVLLLLFLEYRQCNVFFFSLLRYISFSDSENCNNNKPLSNGTFPSIFLRSQLNLTYDYRQIHACMLYEECNLFQLTSYSNLLFSPDSSTSEYLFRLTAVLVHHGDMHSGHFVTYRRCPASLRGTSPLSSQWLWVSDDSVRKASLQEALSSSAYLLFYERVQRPGLRVEVQRLSLFLVQHQSVNPHFSPFQAMPLRPSATVHPRACSLACMLFLILFVTPREGRRGLCKSQFHLNLAPCLWRLLY